MRLVTLAYLQLCRVERTSVKHFLGMLALCMLIPLDAEAAWFDVYLSDFSVPQGGQIEVHISTNLEKYDLAVTKVGENSHIVYERNALRGEAHPIPENAYSADLNWPSVATIPIGTDWPSGFYQIALTRPNGSQTVFLS